MAAAGAILRPMGRAGVAAITTGWSAWRNATPGHGPGGGHDELLQDPSQSMLGLAIDRGWTLRGDGGSFQRGTDTTSLPVCLCVGACLYWASFCVYACIVVCVCVFACLCVLM